MGQAEVSLTRSRPGSATNAGPSQSWHSVSSLAKCQSASAHSSSRWQTSASAFIASPRSLMETPPSRSRYSMNRRVATWLYVVEVPFPQIRGRRFFLDFHEKFVNFDR